MTPTNTQIDAIRAALHANPGAVLEDLAKAHGVTTRDVLALLPETEAVSVDGDRFEQAMREMTTWGELTLVVNTGDVILEVRGPLPEGSLGQGYYNLHGKPIDGHLKASNCDLIAFVSRKLFSSDTHSVQFYNRLGDCMFKVYLRRDAQRQLIPEQVERFRALRDGLIADH
ncbi:heme utilization cystosolic carrier protein HutX [Thiocystis violascens]|uniref:Putative heme iron utilization protein n=1 Tax=Thiocystis violascens (strain ATCC 17096 / DSM 198 / 6111) TaxID=765911 RepID=I3Y5C6_THIV6|nr:heme utilization cystosolic carrier protein HutX [Thiocystis violascens]AFL72194.1 putative heme iron utilization protein [Thiocystis violascens DSM 198]